MYGVTRKCYLTQALKLLILEFLPLLKTFTTQLSKSGTKTILSSYALKPHSQLEQDTIYMWWETKIQHSAEMHPEDSGLACEPAQPDCLLQQAV